MLRKSPQRKPHSAETRAKMSAKAKARDHSELIIRVREMSKRNKGRKATDEHRAAIRAAYAIRKLEKEQAMCEAGVRCCTKCKKTLQFSAFSKNASGLLGLTATCKPCRVIQTKAWSLANPEKVTAYAHESKARKYGITLKQRDDIYAAQGGQCAVCKSSISCHGRGTHTDHCHVTGIVRGLLCHLCNQGLGLFKDDASVLLRASEYVTKSNAAHSLR